MNREDTKIAKEDKKGGGISRRVRRRGDTEKMKQFYFMVWGLLYFSIFDIAAFASTYVHLAKLFLIVR